MAAPLVDKRSTSVQDMFAGVAPRYDLLNRVLSGCLDTVWRRRAARALDLSPGSRVADLCCGTGDQALAVAALGHSVVAADFCLPMLALAKRKYRRREAPPIGLAGDSLELPFPSAAFDGATAAFGLRNVEDLDRALAEIARILRPGGRVALLEFAVPENSVLRRLYLFYFLRILPAIGRILSPRASAYRYLPESVLGFPQRQAFVERMESSGIDGEWRSLAGGIVCLYTGARRERG